MSAHEITPELIKRVHDLQVLATACRETGKPEWADYYDQNALAAIRDVQRANLRHLARLNQIAAIPFAFSNMATDFASAFQGFGQAFARAGEILQTVTTHKDQVALAE